MYNICSYIRFSDLLRNLNRNFQKPINYPLCGVIISGHHNEAGKQNLQNKERDPREEVLK